MERESIVMSYKFIKAKVDENNIRIDEINNNFLLLMFHIFEIRRLFREQDHLLTLWRAIAKVSEFYLTKELKELRGKNE